MNREDIIKLAREANIKQAIETPHLLMVHELERFAALVAAAERDACAKLVEAYQIPVGNSRSGELACKWTYDALKEIRDDIRARGEA